MKQSFGRVSLSIAAVLFIGIYLFEMPAWLTILWATAILYIVLRHIHHVTQLKNNHDDTDSGPSQKKRLAQGQKPKNNLSQGNGMN